MAKTTPSITVRGTTAAAGYETLLIDLDPQGYLTNGVGLKVEYTAKSTTLYDALNTQRNKPKVLRAATHRGLHRSILYGRRAQYADDLF